MVPVAGAADLDDVDGELRRAGCQLVQLVRGAGRTGRVLQALAEHPGHLGESLLAADRTGHLGGLAVEPGGAQQVRTGIADRRDTGPTGVDISEQRTALQRVVDDLSGVSHQPRVRGTTDMARRAGSPNAHPAHQAVPPTLHPRAPPARPTHPRGLPPARVSPMPPTVPPRRRAVDRELSTSHLASARSGQQPPRRSSFRCQMNHIARPGTRCIGPIHWTTPSGVTGTEGRARFARLRGARAALRGAHARL